VIPMPGGGRVPWSAFRTAMGRAASFGGISRGSAFSRHIERACGAAKRMDAASKERA
jgi:hypothetical protein